MQVVPSVVRTTVSVVKCRLLSSNNAIFFSLTLIFHKIEKKTFKDILSGLHFTTFVNILPFFRVEIIYTIQLKESFSTCFPDRPMKGGDILDF